MRSHLAKRFASTALRHIGVAISRDGDYDGERVSGVRAQHRGKAAEFRAKSVVLACGGFESNRPPSSRKPQGVTR